MNISLTSVFTFLSNLFTSKKPTYEVPKKGEVITPRYSDEQIDRVEVIAKTEFLSHFDISALDVINGGNRAVIMRLGLEQLLKAKADLEPTFYQAPVVHAGVEWKLDDTRAILLAAHGYARTVLGDQYYEETGLDKIYHFIPDGGVWVNVDLGDYIDLGTAELLFDHFLIFQNKAADSDTGKLVIELTAAINDALYPH